MLDMTPSTGAETRRSGRRIPAADPGFSLVEMLLVMAVAGTLLALAAPSLLNLGPSRKAASMELSGFLERAGMHAVTREEPVYVAFADQSHPVEGQRFRAYASFVPDSAGEENQSIAGRSLRQVSEWISLPEGIVFGNASLFEAGPGYAFRTLHDFPEKRPFAVSSESGSQVSAEFPYLVFSPSGGILYPPITDADALNLALVEGNLNQRGDDILTQGGTRADATPRAELLRIAYYTGRATVLTD